MKTRKLEAQIAYVVQQSTHLGADKRSLKAQGALDNKIVGMNHQKAIWEAGQRLGQYMRVTEGVRMLRDITPAQMERYLQARAKTASAVTIAKEKSYLRKLEVCAQAVFRIKTNWGIDKAQVSTRGSAYSKTVALPRETQEKIMDAMRGQRSSSWRCVDIGRRAGLRINECCHLQKSNVITTPGTGKYGYGFIRIIAGPEGGAKGGRPRPAPFLSESDRQAAKRILDGITDASPFVSSSKTGGQLKARSVAKQLRTAMKTAGAYTKGNLEHAMRKEYAQTVYDLERHSGQDKRHALLAVDAALGHGDRKNDVRLHSTYVHNQW